MANEIKNYANQIKLLGQQRYLEACSEWSIRHALKRLAELGALESKIEESERGKRVLHQAKLEKYEQLKVQLTELF